MYFKKRFLSAALILSTFFPLAMVFGPVSTWADDWHPITPPESPSARQGHSMVTLPDGRVILFGGEDVEGTLLNDTYTFDINGWKKMIPTNTPPPVRRDHQAWTSADVMYIYGGYGENGALDDLWSYDSVENTWHQEDISGPRPAARHGQTSTTLTDGSEIIIGGVDADGNPLEDCWKLNGDNTYSQLQDAPEAYVDGSAELSPDGDLLYVFGRPGSLGIYRISTDRWALVSGGPPNGPGCITWQGTNGEGEPVVYISGGKDYQGNPMSEVWTYNLYGGELTRAGSMSWPVVDGAAAPLYNVATHSSEIVIFGGSTYGVPTNNTMAGSISPSPSESAKSSKPLTSGANRNTSLDKGDPINMATAEYHFDMGLFNLDGPFPLSFSIYYGSQFSKQAANGLPHGFTGDHEAIIFNNSESDDIVLELGNGNEVEFIHGGVDPGRPVPWQLRQTAEYYYAMNPIDNVVYTLARHEASYDKNYKTYELMSAKSDGTTVNNDSGNADISGSGRYVVFASNASNLVAGDTNNSPDIFVHDRWTGVTNCASTAVDGTLANDGSATPSISGDGRYIAFESLASNLVQDDTNVVQDIFIRDTRTNEIERIMAGGGNEPDGNMSRSSISQNGRYVAFDSTADNLVADDTNGHDDVFVYDRQTGNIVMASIAWDGTPSNDDSQYGAVTSDGRYAVFYSKADNLVTGDANNSTDVFIRDFVKGVTSRISVSTDDTEGNADSTNPVISDDGNRVAFVSDADNLVSDDNNNSSDVFVRDLATGETIRVSEMTAGAEGDNLSRSPDISPDGRFVVFESYASNLVADDTNNVSDIFLHDMDTHETIRASHTYGNAESNLNSYNPSVGDYGKYIAFESVATNLVSTDKNDKKDIFIAGRFNNSYSPMAFLARMEDRNGNALDFEYPANPSNRGPDRISDGLGRELDFTYDAQNYLTTVEDGRGRAWRFAYEDNPSDNPGGGGTLRSITDPMGGVTSFTYDQTSKHRIAATRLPAGNTPYTRTYDASVDAGIVSQQTDAYGNVMSITKDNYKPHEDEESRFTVNNPDGSSEVFEHNHYATVAKSLTNADGKTMHFLSGSSKQEFAGIMDRLGDTTIVTRHEESGKTASYKDAQGNITTYTYTAQDQAFTNPINGEQVAFTFYNLTRIDYPDGTNESFTYDSKGNMLSRMDRAGKTRSFSYNSQGQALSVENPEGGIVTYTYNADGTPADITDPETGATNFGYDTFMRMNLITYPDGNTVQTAYDANDRITSITDERGKTWTYSYDENGNLINNTDPAGKSTQYAYDLMDRIISVTDKAGKITATTYDNMGRIASVTNPDNILSEMGYDPCGRLNAITRGGKTWHTGYDDEGVASSFTTPAGHITGFQTNRLGPATAVTDPLNRRETFARDAMQRITSVTDAMGRATDFTYDADGRITEVTLPSADTSSCQYNSLGRITRLTDLNGGNWEFTYSAMGRTTGFTDPTGHSWSYQYNNRGRIKSTTMPDGTIVTRQYDSTGNVLQISYGENPVFNYTYDDLDRLLSTEGIGLAYGPRGEIISTVSQATAFDATYGDSGRLETVSYADGAFTVTYTYDPASGLLMGVSDSLTNASIAFTYNADDILTGITRSNSINTAFTLDDAARITRITHGSLADMQYTLDDADQIVKAEMNLPLDPGALLTNGTETRSYDGACRVSSTGYAYDGPGRRTSDPFGTYIWDNAGRLIGAGGTSLTYNGLGNVSGRTEGSSAIHYFYNYAVGLRPIVAEQDGGGTWLRYYVYTPSGRLLYMIDAQNGNAVSFYHFDRVGSTLFLTDEAGAITDSYAYTPYGRLLKHNGNNPQPFTFAGEFGVRQEGISGRLYQMRARYYDAGTGSFLSRESLWPDVTEPRMLNPYQYAMAQPNMLTDPTGMKPTENKSRLRDGQRNSAKKFKNKALNHKSNKHPLVNAVASTIKNKVVSKVRDKAIKTGVKILAKKSAYVGAKLAEAGLEAGEAANPIGLAIDGVLSANDVGNYIGDAIKGDSQAIHERASQTLTYQAVGVATKLPVAKKVVNGVGSVVSWLMGD